MGIHDDKSAQTPDQTNKKFLKMYNFSPDEIYWLESVFEIWSICLVLQIKSCLTCQLGKFSEVGHRPKLNSRKKKNFFLCIFYCMNHEKLQQTFLEKDAKKVNIGYLPQHTYMQFLLLRLEICLKCALSILIFLRSPK